MFGVCLFVRLCVRLFVRLFVFMYGQSNVAWAARAGARFEGRGPVHARHKNPIKIILC